MTTHDQTTQPPKVNDGYERRDASMTVVASIGIGLLVLLVAAGFGMHALLNAWGPVEREPAPGEAYAIEPTDDSLLVQLRDLRERYEARDEKRLEEYEWISERAKLARIPIEEAMAILAERGQWFPPPEEPAGTTPPVTEQEDGENGA